MGAVCFLPKKQAAPRPFACMPAQNPAFLHEKNRRMPIESALATALGISPAIFHWVIMPLLIYCARVTDVSINTLRVIFMLNGRRLPAMMLGFMESLIWLVAIGQILQNVGSALSYVAYAGGFASGIYTGMLIESKLAIGNVMVRVVAERGAQGLIDMLRTAGYRFTCIEASGSRSEVTVVFMVVPRQQLSALLQQIEQADPTAFYTVEGVKHVSDRETLLEGGVPGRGRRSFFRNFIRK
jgi:uncharacterized protein YebE (UPF0316 family)